MKYNYREGVEKQKSRKWVILPIIGLLCAAYAFVNVLSPEILYVVEPADTTAKKLISQQPNQGDNRIYIPKINADIEIAPVEGEEAFALEKSAVQRSSNSGNPRDGGNFVLVANRFSLGYTPMETKAKSPFYHISKLGSDDDIYVDYQGTRYAYKVEERKPVGDDMAGIEDRTDTQQLTIYTAETGDRQVITAKQTGKVIWSSGQPKLQPLPDS